MDSVTMHKAGIPRALGSRGGDAMKWCLVVLVAAILLLGLSMSVEHHSEELTLVAKADGYLLEAWVEQGQQIVDLGSIGKLDVVVDLGNGEVRELLLHGGRYRVVLPWWTDLSTVRVVVKGEGYELVGRVEKRLYFR